MAILILSEVKPVTTVVHHRSDDDSTTKVTIRASDEGLEEAQKWLSSVFGSEEVWGTHFGPNYALFEVFGSTPRSTPQGRHRFPWI